MLPNLFHGEGFAMANRMDSSFPRRFVGSRPYIIDNNCCALNKRRIFLPPRLGE
jgi:hypothetical protein